MTHSYLILLLWLTAGPAAIGHDIEIVWVKGIYDSTGGTVFGYGLGAGDVDGDGYLDIAASFGIYDQLNQEWEGGVFIFSGNPLDTFLDMKLDPQVGPYPGILVMDINGDSIDDLFACNQGAHTVRGMLGPLEDGQEPNIFLPDEYLPTIGWTSLANAGDMNNDGWEDLVAGAYTSRHGDVGGAAYIYFGGPGFGTGEHDPDVIIAGHGGSFGWQVGGGNVIDDVFDGWLEGEVNEHVGCSFSPAGDFDGDGRSEFLASNWAVVTLERVWLCKFTGAGVEEKEDIDKGLQLELSTTVTQEAVRFYYDKPTNKEASLTIYDVSGALVRRWIKLTGSSVEWDLRDEQGRKVPSGVYTARLDIKDGGATSRNTRKVVVLR